MTKTTLSKASSGSNQLRTTIPLWVVEQFDLKPGDKVDWYYTPYNNTLGLKKVKK